MGPAGCHLESSTFIGWQRLNLTREPINVPVMLLEELLSPCLAQRANMGTTGALCLLSRPQERGVSLKIRLVDTQPHNPRKRLGFPAGNGSLRASSARGGGGGSQACWAEWLHVARGPRALEMTAQLLQTPGRVMGRVRAGSPSSSISQFSQRGQGSPGQCSQFQKCPC